MEARALVIADVFVDRRGRDQRNDVLSDGEWSPTQYRELGNGRGRRISDETGIAKYDYQTFTTGKDTDQTSVRSFGTGHHNYLDYEVGHEYCCGRMCRKTGGRYKNQSE